MNNLREKRKVFQELFPGREISSPSPVQSQKVHKRLVPNKSRISPRLVDPSKDVGSIPISDTASNVVDVNVDQQNGLRKSTGNVSKEYSCLICEFKCSRKYGLSRHVSKKHQPLDEPLSCSR